MNFNKKGFELFRTDVENALKEVEKKHGGKYFLWIN